MKSPLKSKPLNNPGQSLEKRLLDIALDRVFFPLIVCCLVIAYAAYEWIRYYFNIEPQPKTWTLIAVVVLSSSMWKIFRAFKEVKAVKQGIAGEKAVGQFLERLRSEGAEIFHDVEGENFNLDHVIIHTTGVYVVETKTMTKPKLGKPELTFDGASILLKNKPLMRNPIPQVSAASAWLKELLLESSGRRFQVRGIVTFPGWYIHSSKNTSHNAIWVLNPKAIPAFVRKQNDILSPEDVHLLKFHLGKYIRALP